eukprot:1757384-Pyramimonas_sp.AAC.1
MPRNGVLGTPRPRSALLLAKKVPGILPRIAPRRPWGVMMLSFDPTRSLSVFAVRSCGHSP